MGLGRSYWYRPVRQAFLNGKVKIEGGGAQNTFSLCFKAIMRFNLITSMNGVGLERDYNILRIELECRGHTVNGVAFGGVSQERADVNVFLEVISEKFFPLAPRQWIVPNPEWWSFSWDRFFPRFEFILAKTRDCYRAFEQKGPCFFLGWRSRDLFDPNVPKEDKFIHVAGKSQAKNTQAVVSVWEQEKVPVDLTVISESYIPKNGSRIKLHRRVEEDELQRLMNSHRFHIMPSAYEGWGHALHEALGVGAVVITTDAPPMNEISSVITVRTNGQRTVNMGVLHSVSCDELARVVNGALEDRSRDPARLEQLVAGARKAFLDEAQGFGQRLDELLARTVR